MLKKWLLSLTACSAALCGATIMDEFNKKSLAPSLLVASSFGSEISAEIRDQPKAFNPLGFQNACIGLLSSIRYDSDVQINCDMIDAPWLALSPLDAKNIFLDLTSTTPYVLVDVPFSLDSAWTGAHVKDLPASRVLENSQDGSIANSEGAAGNVESPCRSPRRIRSKDANTRAR